MHFLTAAQVEALADAIAPPDGALIRFAAYTGLRPQRGPAVVPLRKEAGR